MIPRCTPMMYGRKKCTGFAFLPFLLANWQLIALAFAVVFALKWFGDFKEGLIESGREEVRGQWAKASDVRRATERAQISKASEKLEKGNQKARVIYREITKSVDRYIDRPVYRNVCFDDDGLRDANAALRGDRAEGATGGKPDKPVSRPNPAG